MQVSINSLQNYTLQEIKQIEDGMRPLASSSVGFISWDDNLIDVLNEDEKYLLEVSITHEQIADSIKGLVRKADAIEGYSKEKLIGRKFKISGFSTNGFQECPFPLANEVNCFEGRRDYIVTNLKTNEFFAFTDLGIHLCEKHGFYQGKSMPYRMDPAHIIKVLDLKADNYKKNIVKDWKWVSVCDDECQEKNEDRLKKYAKQIVVIDEFAVAYLGVPYNDYTSFIYSGKTKREKLTASYKELGLTELEIQTMIKKEERKWSFTKGSLDKLYIHSSGKQYLHLVNKKDRDGNLRGAQKLNAPHWNLVVDGVKIKENVSHKNIYIFEMMQTSYADIDCD
jgi:hypothetical protein